MGTQGVHDKIEQLIKKGDSAVVWEDIDKIKPGPKNPRKISKQKFEELKKSITDFPEMMALRPGVVNDKMELMGSNQRHKAAKSLGWHKFPIIHAKNLTEEQLNEFIIKDNLSAGEWDAKLLKDYWNIEDLTGFGMDVTKLFGTDSIQGTIVFSTELDQASNFVVLKFNKDIDWLQIQTMLGITSVHSARQNGKPWSKGVGRVVDGVNAIKLIQASGKEA